MWSLCSYCRVVVSLSTALNKFILRGTAASPSHNWVRLDWVTSTKALTVPREKRWKATASPPCLRQGRLLETGGRKVWSPAYTPHREQSRGLLETGGRKSGRQLTHLIVNSLGNPRKAGNPVATASKGREKGGNPVRLSHANAPPLVSVWSHGKTTCSRGGMRKSGLS
jgi:hypothetical protein